MFQELPTVQHGPSKNVDRIRKNLAIPQVAQAHYESREQHYPT